MFLRDERRNRYEGGVLQLSELLDWYEGDFKWGDGSIKSFVAAPLTDDPAEAATIDSRDTRVRFLAYDWGLNGR